MTAFEISVEPEEHLHFFVIDSTVMVLISVNLEYLSVLVIELLSIW